MGLGSPPGFA
jgi:hypothetical protein